MLREISNSRGIFLELPEFDLVNKNELITLETEKKLTHNNRLIQKSSKDIDISKDTFENKNNIENYEGSNVKMYSNIY